MRVEIAEKIYEKVKILPLKDQKEVLSFINGLKTECVARHEKGESGLDRLWKDIDEIVARVPKEAWEGVPTDGSINVDHYLYGARKRKK